jgi:hypothetical protein
VEKPLEMFAKNKLSRDGRLLSCKACMNAKAKARLASDEAYAEARRQAVRDAYRTNPAFAQKVKDRARAYSESPEGRARNSATKRAYRQLPHRVEAGHVASRKYKRDNPHKVRAKDVQRRLACRQATPKWANWREIEGVYQEARAMRERTGIRYEVDHIVPLRGKTVCGLHCEANLQILPARDNGSKNNKFWPDMPDAK